MWSSSYIHSIEQRNNPGLSATFSITGRRATSSSYVQKHPNSAPCKLGGFFWKPRERVRENRASTSRSSGQWQDEDYDVARRRQACRPHLRRRIGQHATGVA